MGSGIECVLTPSTFWFKGFCFEKRRIFTYIFPLCDIIKLMRNYVELNDYSLKEVKKSDRQYVTDGSENRLFLFEKLVDYFMVERKVFV